MPRHCSNVLFVLRSPISAAAAHLLANCPIAFTSTTRKTWTPTRLIRDFIEDDLAGRYLGERLVFSGTLRALTLPIPEAFRSPYVNSMQVH